MSFMNNSERIWLKLISDNNLEEKCMWQRIAITKRNNEIAHGYKENNTETYQEMGCYKCDGRNEDCPAYTKQEANK